MKIPKRKKRIFPLFLVQDFSLTSENLCIKIYTRFDDIHMQGSVSQTLDIGPSFEFMSKTNKQDICTTTNLIRTRQ